MKTMNLLSVVCLFIFVHLSCQKDDVNADTDIDNSFSGYYKIASIESSIPVDMNNDGIKTNNILNEISGFHFFSEETVLRMYTPDTYKSLAVIRPLAYQTNNALLIDFNYPCQNILYEDEDVPRLHSYSGQFRNYSYKLKADNVIEVIDNNPEYNAKYGKINSAVRLEDESFRIDLTVKLYDFKDKVWVETKEIVKYVKVSEYSNE